MCHASELPAATSAEIAEADLDRDTEIETTLEELEGYQSVKAIARGEVKPQRVTQRDAKNDFAVLLDDNNRKPIAWLHYLRSIIYAHADEIRAAVRRYRD